MKRSSWLGIGAGTLIASICFWFGFYSLTDSRITGLVVIAIGVIFSMYAMTALSGVEDAASVAYSSALYAVVTAITLLVMYMISDSLSYMVASVTMSLGVGGTIGLPPISDPYRTLVRFAAVVAVSAIAVSVYWVDYTVYAMISPLIALPSVGLADKLFDKVRDVVAESP